MDIDGLQLPIIITLQPVLWLTAAAKFTNGVLIIHLDTKTWVKTVQVEKYISYPLRQKELYWTELAGHSDILVWASKPLSSHFLLKTLLCSSSEVPSVPRQYECVSKFTHFPSSRAKHFSTNWAWERTGCSPEAHRGRPRKVSHKTRRSSHIPPVIRCFQSCRKETFSLNSRTMGSFPRNEWECLEMQIPELWLKNSFSLIGISFCFF